MRDIKFRCWSSHAQSMASWKDLVGGGKIHLLAANCHPYPVMQYTGLKDCNDVEIYEGDILKVTSTKNDHGQRGATELLVVTYFMGNACFSFPNSLETGTPIYPNLMFMVKEVVGNIYEHPELLK